MPDAGNVVGMGLTERLESLPDELVTMTLENLLRHPNQPVTREDLTNFWLEHAYDHIAIWLRMHGAPSDHLLDTAHRVYFDVNTHYMILPGDTSTYNPPGFSLSNASPLYISLRNIEIQLSSPYDENLGTLPYQPNAVADSHLIRIVRLVSTLSGL